MVSNRNTLSKKERLSWKRHMDLLFSKGISFVSFPLRVIYLEIEEEEALSPVSILISVPKKKFKRAVKRNLIKRQVREAYRIQKQDITTVMTGHKKGLLIAFLYIDKEIHHFDTMKASVQKALAKLTNKMSA